MYGPKLKFKKKKKFLELFVGYVVYIMHGKYLTYRYIQHIFIMIT